MRTFTFSIDSHFINVEGENVYDAEMKLKAFMTAVIEGIDTPIDQLPYDLDDFIHYGMCSVNAITYQGKTAG